MVEHSAAVGILAAGVILAFVFRKALRWLFRPILNSAAGMLVLWGAGSFGMTVGINLFSLLMTGLLGVPGAGFLILLHYFM